MPCGFQFIQGKKRTNNKVPAFLTLAMQATRPETVHQRHPDHCSSGRSSNGFALYAAASDIAYSDIVRRIVIQSTLGRPQRFCTSRWSSDYTVLKGKYRRPISHGALARRRRGRRSRHRRRRVCNRLDFQPRPSWRGRLRW